MVVDWVSFASGFFGAFLGSIVASISLIYLNPERRKERKIKRWRIDATFFMAIFFLFGALIATFILIKGAKS